MQYLIRTKVFLLRRPVSDSGHLHGRTQERSDMQYLHYEFTTLSAAVTDFIRYCSARSDCFHILFSNEPNIRLGNGSLFLRNKFFTFKHWKSRSVQYFWLGVQNRNYIESEIVLKNPCLPILSTKLRTVQVGCIWSSSSSQNSESAKCSKD